MAAPVLAAPAIAQGALSLIQLIRGANAKVDRPVRETPASIKAATTVAENLTRGERPGRDLDIQEIKKGVSNQISQVKRNSKSGSDVTAATTAAIASENNAINRLGINDANFKINANLGLVRALSNQGSQEAQNFEFNEAQKFAEESQRKSALIGGGIQNANTALQDAGTLAVMRKLGMLNLLEN